MQGIRSIYGSAGLCGLFTTLKNFKKMDINSWVNRVIKGIGGFESWEDHEGVIFHTSREEGIAEFVIRCLANPSCEGSDKVIEAIIEQREKLSKTPKKWPSESLPG